MASPTASEQAGKENESDHAIEERGESNTKFSYMPLISQGGPSGWHIQTLGTKSNGNDGSSMSWHTSEAVNRKKPQPSKHVHERVDGLQHLSKSQSDSVVRLFQHGLLIPSHQLH